MVICLKGAHLERVYLYWGGNRLTTLLISNKLPVYLGAVIACMVTVLGCIGKLSAGTRFAPCSADCASPGLNCSILIVTVSLCTGSVHSSYAAGSVPTAFLCVLAGAMRLHRATGPAGDVFFFSLPVMWSIPAPVIWRHGKIVWTGRWVLAAGIRWWCGLCSADGRSADVARNSW